MTQLAFDLFLEPTIAMKRGDQTVWQCAWCGCVVVCPTGRKPTGTCPAECQHPDDGWLRQHFPIAGLRLTRPQGPAS